MAPISEPRERLLDTAVDLFYRQGIHAVGVDLVLSEAQVTRATMYRHFKGKEGLVVAYLEREDTAIRALFAAAADQGGSPRELLDAVVEGVVADATTVHRRGCPFINASAEYPDPDSPVREVVQRHRTWFRQTLAELLAAADVSDPEAGAATLVMLRDAMFVGGYLDGEPAGGPTSDELAAVFRAAARTVIA